jgi:hypothetical protein
VGDGTLEWFSCEACSTHMSSGECYTAAGCTWKTGTDGEGMCILSGLNDISCEYLSKPLCDRYRDSSLYISGISVIDAPCMFNGPPDSVFLLCASVSSIGVDNCAVIKTNDLVGTGNERYCDNASSVFGFSYNCQWTEGHHGGWGSCGSVYYMSNNGMTLLRFLV